MTDGQFEGADGDAIVRHVLGAPPPEVAKQPLAYPTYEEIRRAIPPQCFEKSLPKSLFYLVFDYAIIAGFYFAVPYVEKYAGWPGLLVWAYFLGMFGFSLFVVGHDCGHTTFSNYPIINDLCGHLAHAPLFAPYWPWAQSHREHHKWTGHLTKDRGHAHTDEERFYELDFFRRHFRKLPIAGLFLWQTYTILGLPDGSHFWPFSSMFTTWKQRVQCVISGLCCCLAAGVALVLCDYNWINFLKYYYMPLCFYGLWLVMITYLQHTDEEAVVYEEGHWNFVKGQSETIDRYYGFGIDFLTHHITSDHVAHHFFFTKIPHYHLPEATKAIKKVFEKYPGVYRSVSTYDHLLEFLRLNVKLDYLVGKGTGMLKYRTSQSTVKKAE